MNIHFIASDLLAVYSAPTSERQTFVWKEVMTFNAAMLKTMTMTIHTLTVYEKVVHKLEQYEF